MRSSEGERTGAQGISEVKAKFQSIGWAPFDVPKESDLGTDLFIQARDARRFDRGLFLGAQVKTGPSYFSEPVVGADGGSSGWWYREKDGDHFDYWTTHSIPHLVVLHDLEGNRSYWTQVKADSVKSTGKGNKIFVPAGQRIESGQLDSLMAVAARQRPKVDLEGSAWTSDSPSLAPGQRFRYALLAPRLVAPHPNAGTDFQINAPQAVALIAQGRTVELENFADRQASVPHPEKEAMTSSDWGWRFVGALWRWLVNGDSSHLSGVVSQAPDSPRRVVAAIANVCALLDEELHGEAIQMLNELITPDDAAPLDWAWLCVQRGRIRADLGDMDNARADALATAKALVGDEDDITNSVLRAASTSLIWQSLDWSERRVEDLIANNDTAVSWWRSQTISTALAEASDQSFREWSNVGGLRFVAEDIAHSRLLAAVLGVHFSAEQGVWRGTSSLLARHEIMTSDSWADAQGVGEGLDRLRRSGDSSSMLKAARWIRRAGPLASLASATERIGTNSWTQTAAQTNFKLWAKGGDLLDADQATEAAQICLDVANGNPPEAIGRLRSTFWVALDALEAVAMLVRAAGEETARNTANYVASLPSDLDQVMAISVLKVVKSLPFSTLDSGTLDRLRDFANGQKESELACGIFELQAKCGDDQARAALLDRAGQGDICAFAALGGRGLNESAAGTLAEILEPRVKSIIDSARHSSWGMGGYDAVGSLAALSLVFPSQARWEIVLGALADPNVSISDKVGACRVIAGHAGKLPEKVRLRLVSMIGTIASTEYRLLPGEEESAFGPAERMAFAIDAFDEETTRRHFARLAMRGWEERRELAWALGSRDIPGMGSMLLVLAGDDSLAVREAAASVIARRVAANIASPAEKEVLGLLSSSDGVAVPLAVIRGLAGQRGALPRSLGEVVDRLRHHPSATVRSGASTL